MVLVLEPPEDFSVLLIDDEPSFVELMQQVFHDMPVNVMVAENAQTGWRLVKQHRPRLVLLDLNLRDVHGLDLLEEIVQFDPRIEVILFSGDPSPSIAVEAVQKGAADYLVKPIATAALRNRVERSIQFAQKNKQTYSVDAELLSSFQFHGLVGRSPRLLDLFNMMRRIAPHFRTVLLSGPSGTGKELVARALHDLSPNRKGAFVVCNCAGLPESLAESELFGYASGAFTGAIRDKVGIFEQANHGTVFLDEIGEMPIGMQPKLLRVLQTHEIQRVGSPAMKKLDIRVIAATNRDLQLEVAEQRFREDLYYRLSVIHLKLPALADRKEDLPLLQRYFVQKFAKEYKKAIVGISRRAQNLLSEHLWPGNVRELENVIASACMMCDAEVLDIAHFPPALQSKSSIGGWVGMSLKEAQQKHALHVLKLVDGNKARAAEVLGISRSTLYNILAGAEIGELG